MGYKDLRFGQIVYILVFYNISFSWLLPLDGFQFIFLPRVYCEQWKGRMSGIFSLDKERPKLPFNSLSPSYCEVYSCLLLIYRSISKKIKSEKKERKKTTENIKLFQLLALITSLCKGANDH